MKLKSTLKATASALGMAVSVTAHAAVPCEWSATPQRPAPAQFDRFHGESLDFRCTFTGFGALPFDGASDVRLWYQTNGMGAAWWSIPATVSSNVLTATFTPDRDPGAERLAVFFGAPSNAYAAAQVRFRNSPGATPNDLQPPSVLDWQAELSAATNALAVSSAAAFMSRSDAYTKAETDARIVELSPPTSLAPATNYTDEVTGALSNALETGAMQVWNAWSSQESQHANYADVAGELSDGTSQRSGAQIFAQLDAASRLTTNDVCAIVTNETEAGFSPWKKCDGWIDPPETRDFQVVWSSGNWDIQWEEWDGEEWIANVGNYGGDDSNATIVTFSDSVPSWTDIWFERDYMPPRNSLGFARISDLPSTNGIITAASVTNTVRTVAYAVNDYIFDGDVCWRRQMLQGGYLEYVAVTNIDVTLPENYKALEALENARRNQE